MKFQKLFTSCLSLSFITLSMPVQAQFEGQISINLYSDNNGVKEVNQMSMYVTSDRIFLKGEEEMNFGDSFNSGGLLIRNDKKDFVVLMEDNDALQVTKSEIEGLFNMLGSWGSSSSSKNPDEKMSYTYTGKKRTIKGYETTELLIQGREDGVDTFISVWLTPNIDINWGMLAERWKNLPEDAEVAVNGISQDAVFKGKNFPMLVEITDKGITKTVMEVNTINESSIAKAMVQIPTGVNLIGVTELMFKMMSGN